jgi:two-component system, NarL family, nitrate/nitrite response regulator NarL
MSRSERVTVIIADDHPVYRSGLARTISQRPELKLVAESESGREALDAIREHVPQVAVIDLKMPDLDGLAILNAVKRENLETKIVMLTGYAEGETAYEVMAAGAAAYISKTSEPDTWPPSSTGRSRTRSSCARPTPARSSRTASRRSCA